MSNENRQQEANSIILNNILKKNINRTYLPANTINGVSIQISIDNNGSIGREFRIINPIIYKNNDEINVNEWIKLFDENKNWIINKFYFIFNGGMSGGGYHYNGNGEIEIYAKDIIVIIKSNFIKIM